MCAFATIMSLPYSHGFVGAIALSIVLAIVYSIILSTYNVFFHPLRHYPGPKHWAAGRFCRYRAAVAGTLDGILIELHAIHGPIVRFSPDELSFIDPDAWDDIYGSVRGRGQLRKDPTFYNAYSIGVEIVRSPDDEYHARLRRLFGPAFSERAIKELEPNILGYVDLLMEKLKDVATAGQATNMVQWFNWTTFDITGDLAFGAPFGCLRDTKYHEWVAVIFSSLNIMPYMQAINHYTIARLLSPLVIPLAIPSRLLAGIALHKAYAMDAINARALRDATQSNPRRDFMSYVLKHRDPKTDVPLTNAEIVANTGTLVIAGSETTATLLSSLLYYLLCNPVALALLTSEIRKGFRLESELSFTALTSGRTPYLDACISEALRMRPPGAGLFPRVTPTGPPSFIAGHAIPSGTSVSMHYTAAFRSSANFRDALSFVPERWLGAEAYAQDKREVHAPFGVGPRNCIGQALARHEARLIMARLLWRFDIVLGEGMQGWAEKSRTFIVWENKPLMVNLSVREGL